MDPRIEGLIAQLREGHRLTGAELERLLADGCDAGALLDALVLAADGPASRSFHRALGLLRDLCRGARP